MKTTLPYIVHQIYENTVNYYNGKTEQNITNLSKYIPPRDAATPHYTTTQHCV